MNLYWLTAICLALGGFTVAGCASQEPAPSAATQPAPAITLQALDEQVIEAALIDIATGADEDSSTLRLDRESKKILLSNVCRDRTPPVDGAFKSAESEKWKPLLRKDRDATVEAAKSAVNRIEAKQFFAPFHPKDSHILLWEHDGQSTQPADPLRHRPIHAVPPGYADDQRLAVVEFGFPWSIHSGDAVFVLRFDGDHWKVLSRHFIYYV